MQIRILTELDAGDAFRLRAEALETDPRAFGSSPVEYDVLGLDAFRARIRESSTGSFVMGAFVEGELAGMAGFARRQRPKDRHKGVIWGVYARRTVRGRGVGRELISKLIERARREPGLEQIQLTVSSSQSAARELYTSLGFEVFGHERHALKIGDEYVDEDHMVLWL